VLRSNWTNLYFWADRHVILNQATAALLLISLVAKMIGVVLYVMGLRFDQYGNTGNKKYLAGSFSMAFAG